MRVLALHLPQYHEVEENNVWWGAGFTEWTNVRGAVPLFAGHQQPQVPLGGSYYDLSDASSLVWQARLAREYEVGGFIFFHYWSSGRLLLEKPVELWLATPDADLPYSLCWANHPWTRSWDGKEHDILMPQTYGGREDWDAHLDYLLPHFLDPRYIRVDGQPMLVLYDAGSIPGVDEMLAHWNDRLLDQGIPGLYVVEYISTKNPRPAAAASSAVYEDEPLYTLRFGLSPLGKARRLFAKRTGRIDFQQYRDVWRRMMRKKRTYGGRDIIQGAFVAWDNSPRRGSRGPMIVRGANPVEFGRFFGSLMRGGRSDASDQFVIVNAWNEWGEGATLEPSEEFGYGYLEQIREAVLQHRSRHQR